MSQLPSRKIVVIGRSGAGKSTVCNAFIDVKEFFKTSKRRAACTLEVKSYTRGDYLIVDTPGFPGDTSGNSALYSKQAEELIGDKTSLVVMVIERVRASQAVKREYAILRECCRDIPMNNLALVISRCGCDDDEEVKDGLDCVQDMFAGKTGLTNLFMWDDPKDEKQATSLRTFLESASSNVPQELVQHGAFRSFQTVGTELQSLYDQAMLSATNELNAVATIKAEVALLERRKDMLMEEVEAHDKKVKMLKMAHFLGGILNRNLVNLAVGAAQYFMSGRKDDLKGQIIKTVKQLEEYSRQGPSAGEAAALAQRIASDRKKELDAWKENLRLAA